MDTSKIKDPALRRVVEACLRHVGNPPNGVVDGAIAQAVEALAAAPAPAPEAHTVNLASGNTERLPDPPEDDAAVVERVAKAMYVDWVEQRLEEPDEAHLVEGQETWDAACESVRDIFMRQARAALAALRGNK